MSIPRKITVNCSKCNKPLPVTVFESINSDFAEDVAQQIMSGDLFNVRCPHCQFTSHLEYDFLYHDMQHGAMVWVLHKKAQNYISRVNEIRTAQNPPYSTLRIVSNMNELKEKVSCLESMRDDRIIELYKVFSVYNLLSQRPDYAVSNTFFSVLSGQEMIYIYDNDGNSVCVELSDKIYNYLKDLYYSSPFSKQFDGNYAVVDYSWAEQMFSNLMALEKEKNDSSATNKAHGTQAKLMCPECGSELPADSAFCQSCGIKLNRAVASNSKVTEKQELGKQMTQSQTNYTHNRNECEDAFQKRSVAAKTAERKRKKRKIIIISIVVVLVMFFIANEAKKEAYRNQSRNMATEVMDESFTNVYADVVTIEPEYFVYQYRTTSSGTVISSGDLWDVVCKCKTVEGETIWASIFYQYYPGIPSYTNDEDDFKPLRYSKDAPMRLVGSIDTARQVVDGLEAAIGNIFVLDVSKLSGSN